MGRRTDPGWRLLEHTADLKVEMRAADLPGLFCVAARCLFELMFIFRGRTQVQTTEARIELTAVDRDELLLDWLRELLFRFSTRGSVVRDATVVSLEASQPSRIVALVHEQQLDPECHELRVEIKTPTYHDFSLVREPDGWRATLLFDV